MIILVNECCCIHFKTFMINNQYSVLLKIALLILIGYMAKIITTLATTHFRRHFLYFKLFPVSFNTFLRVLQIREMTISVTFAVIVT